MGRDAILKMLVRLIQPGFAALLCVGLSACAIDQEEVSRIEQVSPSTVSTHRRSIRRKLGLTNRKVNLTTYLNEAFPEQ